MYVLLTNDLKIVSLANLNPKKILLPIARTGTLLSYNIGYAICSYFLHPSNHLLIFGQSVLCNYLYQKRENNSMKFYERISRSLLFSQVARGHGAVAAKGNGSNLPITRRRQFVNWLMCCTVSPCWTIIVIFPSKPAKLPQRQSSDYNLLT